MRNPPSALATNPKVGSLWLWSEGKMFAFWPRLHPLGTQALTPVFVCFSRNLKIQLFSVFTASFTFPFLLAPSHQHLDRPSPSPLKSPFLSPDCLPANSLFLQQQQPIFLKAMTPRSWSCPHTLQSSFSPLATGFSQHLPHSSHEGHCRPSLGYSSWITVSF